MDGRTDGQEQILRPPDYHQGGIKMCQLSEKVLSEQYNIENYLDLSFSQMKLFQFWHFTGLVLKFVFQRFLLVSLLQQDQILFITR